MNANQLRKLDDLKSGVSVQIDSSGRIRNEAMPDMGWPFVVVYDAEKTKALIIEQQKHTDTANWAMEQQERADTLQKLNLKLEAVKETTKDWREFLIKKHGDVEWKCPYVKAIMGALADLKDGE